MIGIYVYVLVTTRYYTSYTSRRVGGTYGSSILVVPVCPFLIVRHSLPHSHSESVCLPRAGGHGLLSIEASQRHHDDCNERRKDLPLKCLRMTVRGSAHGLASLRDFSWDPVGGRHGVESIATEREVPWVSHHSSGDTTACSTATEKESVDQISCP